MNPIFIGVTVVDQQYAQNSRVSLHSGQLQLQWYSPPCIDLSGNPGHSIIVSSIYPWSQTRLHGYYSV